MTAIPESVIRELGPAIEGLARRVWRERFETYPPPTVTSVLHEGLQDSDDRARRFASIAMSLYKTYRNPSQHDIDRFACGLNEAMMFFLGIRQLLDWSEAIARR